MIIVRGYDVRDTVDNKQLEKIRFSGFSTLIFKNEQELEKYRKILFDEKKESHFEDYNGKIIINLIFFELEGRTKIGRAIQGFLDGVAIESIVRETGVTRNELHGLIKSYLYSAKLLEQ